MHLSWEKHFRVGGAFCSNPKSTHTTMQFLGASNVDSGLLRPHPKWTKCSFAPKQNTHSYSFFFLLHFLFFVLNLLTFSLLWVDSNATREAIQKQDLKYINKTVNEGSYVWILFIMNSISIYFHYLSVNISLFKNEIHNYKFLWLF